MINKTIVTAPATLLWADLSKPNTRFKPEGEWSVKVRLDPSDPAHAKLIESITAYEQQCFEHESEELDKRIAEGGKDVAKLKVLKKNLKQAEPKIKPELDKEANETGMFTLQAKRTASGTKKDGTPWKATIPVFDGTPKLVPDVAALGIGSGSIVCVKMELSSYCAEGLKAAGMTTRLLGVQVRKLVKFGGSGASADDFGAAGEEGFAAGDTTEFSAGGDAADTDDIDL